MRFFAEIAYFGKNYCGWQRQPNALSVQEVVEDKLSTVLRNKIEVIGCGRTDAGVHASQYFLHFDADEIPDDLLSRINKMLPSDIVFYRIFEVDNEAHARFHATKRSYIYKIAFQKHPFRIGQVTILPQAKKYDPLHLIETANLIASYDEFFPFCKSNHGANNLKCQIFDASWEAVEGGLIFRIAANRFLRGMVRLIVGASMRVAEHQMTFEEIQEALNEQKILEKSYSAPAEGLILDQVVYPYI